MIGKQHGGKRVLVVGIGNRDRGDDGVGALVIENLGGRLPGEAELRARSGDLLALIDDWAGFECVIVVDAARMGTPGRVHRIDALRHKLPVAPALPSSHAFGLPEVIALAQALDCAPADIVVYAVEGETFEAGAAMVPQVQAAARLVADKVVAEVHQMMQRHAKGDA